jgi:AcrR family transcriptional regulator
VSDEPRPQRATRRGRATAESFERAARKVIEEQGFLGATIADIAAEAGRSPGSFYNYYDSKEDLLVVWATQFRDTAKARAAVAFDPQADPWDAIRSAVEAHWTTFTEHLAEMVGVSQMAMIDDEFARHWRELRQTALHAIASGIRRAQKQGYCPGLDPDAAASAIVAMLNQFSFTWLAQGGDGDRPLDAETAIDTLATLWYHAVYWKP